MTITLQPQFIRRDSSVPLRMITAGWIVGVAATIFEGAVDNRVLAVLGFTLLAGGLGAASLLATRMWRMIIGSAGGALAALLGYRFAVEDRIIPVMEERVLDLIDRDHLGVVAIGLGVLAIGLGGMLEAVRAQSEPGESPWPVRVLLIAVGTVIALAICELAGVSAVVTILVIIATAAALAAMAWLRGERPPHDFQPSP